jgi:hypothetical protein
MSNYNQYHVVFTDNSEDWFEASSDNEAVRIAKSYFTDDFSLDFHTRDIHPADVWECDEWGVDIRRIY